MKRILSVLVAGLLIGCGGDSTGPGGDGGGGSRVLVLLSGDGQSTGTRGELANSLVVRVQTQNGAPISGVAVAWAITRSAGASGRLVSPQSTTGANGQASAGLQVGDTPGVYEVTASIASGDTVRFTATAEQRVGASLALVSGDGQSGVVSQALTNPFVVRVDDQFGDPLAGEPVNFEISKGFSGSPALSATIEASDQSGEALTTLTLGDKNGTYGVRALGASDTVNFTALASGGALDLISVNSVSPDPVTEGTVLTVDGTGFSTTASENQVWFDGIPAQVQSATANQLMVLVPDFTALDQCLPRRDVGIQAATGPDSADVVMAEVIPGGALVALAPGEDSLFVGPGEVDCIQLPPRASGEEYELMASPVPSGGVVPLQLHVNGRSPLGSPSIVNAPVAPASGSAAPASSSLAGGASLLAPQYALDARLREMERGLRARMRRVSTGTGFRLQFAAVPNVGDTVTFLNSCFSGNITAVARSVSGAAAVFEDTVASGAYTAAEYDSIAANFDNVIFPTDTTYFGSPGDIDSNGRVILLFTAAVNALSPPYNVGIVAGFFCPIDIGSGNNAEMFYLAVPDPAGTLNGGQGPPGLFDKTLARRLADGTVAHEFQHMINAQVGGGGVSDVWINEGLSHLAEEVVGHAALGLAPGSELASSDFGGSIPTFNKYYVSNFFNLGRYLGSPTSPALLLQFDPGAPGTFPMRGASWMFVRYLLDRFATPGTEAGTTKQLIQQGGTAKSAVENVFGVDFEQTVAEWNAMFGVEDRSDLGAPVGSEYTLTSYRLRDIYDVLMGGTSVSPYPLAPPNALRTAALDVSTTLGGSVAAGSGLFTRLGTGGGSGGTAIRLSDVAGNDLAASNMPRLAIIRTK
jgi:hypothetical protein